jgi:methyl-accepting chemotaxis protein
MTNAIVIIILLAVLAFTFAIYSRMGDMIEKMDRRDDYQTGLAYKLTEVRNNANDAGKKSAAALESIHECLKGIRDKVININNKADFLSDMSDELCEVAKDVKYIKSLYEKAAEEAERGRAEEGKEAEVAYDNGEGKQPEPEPEPEPEVAAPSFEESQGEVFPKVEEDIVEAPTKEE